MFCVQCGTNLPEDARFCRSCGVPQTQTVNSPVSSGAVAAAPALKLNPLALPAKARELPYNWGKFQGWVSLVVGIFALLLSPILIGDDKSATFVITSPLLIVGGYAFVCREKFAKWIPYVWMAFAVVNALATLFFVASRSTLTPYQRGEEIGRAVAQLGFQLLFWGLCAVYYNKRVREWAGAVKQEATERSLKCANKGCGHIFPVTDLDANLGIQCPDCREGVLVANDA